MLVPKENNKTGSLFEKGGWRRYFHSWHFTSSICDTEKKGERPKTMQLIYDLNIKIMPLSLVCLSSPSFPDGR